MTVRAALRDVLNEFFVRDGEVYRNTRCDAEVIIYKEKIENAQRAGRASALVKAKRSLSARSTPVKQTFNDKSTHHSPLTTHHINTYDADGFAIFWDSYPKKVAKPKAESAWKKQAVSIADRSLIIAAIDGAKLTDSWQKNGGEFIPHPASWLNARRWEDGVPSATKIAVDA